MSDAYPHQLVRRMARQLAKVDPSAKLLARLRSAAAIGAEQRPKQLEGESTSARTVSPVHRDTPNPSNGGW